MITTNLNGSDRVSTARNRIPAWLIPPFIVGATLALAGGFWDDAWHTERGRDSFFIAPHLAIYGGITLAGAALGAWAWLVQRERGPRALLEYRALVLALLSIAVTLASAPVDNFWHLAFGRDAVIWSPPHVLGIVGTAGLALAILIELNRRTDSWASSLRWVAGALLIAAFSFLVVEYDTDVPQFDEVWYLPVVALGSSFALGLIRLATEERFAASRAGATHLAYFALVALFLTIGGFDTPKAPLILAGAIALDLAAERRLPLPLQAALFVGALYAAYIPALDLLGSGVRLDLADIAIGLPLSFLAVLVVLRLIFGQPLNLGTARRLATASVLSLALFLAWVTPALAHDPGQGDPAGSFDFKATVQGGDLALSAHRDGSDCDRLTPTGLVARRAGEVMNGELIRTGCGFRGQVRLPDEGRWFIYLDARRGGDTIESWIPVKVGEGQRRFTASDRFAYIADREPATALKWTVGTLIYGLVVAFLVAMVALVRGTSSGEPGLGRRRPA